MALTLFWMLFFVALVSPAFLEIILLLNDDLGYGEVNVNYRDHFSCKLVELTFQLIGHPLSPGGGKPIKRGNNLQILRTPNLVRFAQQGIRAVMAYAPAPLCTPSRASIIMGMHTGRIKMRGNSEQSELRQQSVLATTLQRAGYRTGCFGKWGLGRLEGGPWNHGFDEFLGQLGNIEAHTVFPKFITHFISAKHSIPQSNDELRALQVPVHGNLGRVFNEKACPLKRNSTCTYVNDIVREAVFNFMRQGSRPFFVYWAPTYPHAAQYNPNDKYTAYKSAVKRMSRRPPYGMREVFRGHAAQIEAHLDGDVGRFLEFLEHQPSLDQNTLVVITSDNGPHGDEIKGYSANFFQSSGGLRGIKRTMYEGGLRVPTLVRWKGEIPPNEISRTPFALYDLAETFASVAGARISNRFSTNMLPTWKSAGPFETSPDRQYLYAELCRFGGVGTIATCASAIYNITNWQSGPLWKLVVPEKGPPQLFNLRNDPKETSPTKDDSVSSALLSLQASIRVPL